MSLISTKRAFAGSIQCSGVPIGVEEIFVLQYTKLANYFGDQLCEEWGGDYLIHRDEARIVEGCKQFVDWAITKWDRWVRRRVVSRKWSPDNCEVSCPPAWSLGRYSEMYLGCGGEVIRMTTASRILCVPVETLVRWKLELLLDHLVVHRALEMMLGPRPEWLIYQQER